MGRVFSHKTMIDDKPDGRWDGLTLVVIVMGVAGSGKTTVGSALAAARGWRFVDADDLHTPASVAKMARGQPLDDADRAPWLARLRAIIAEALARDEPLVLSCSALKARYRAILVDGDGDRVRLVHLTASPAVLRQRLEARVGHYMKPVMLDSQLATLEAPGEALTLDTSLPVGTLVQAIETALALTAG
jgi:gluconokinase